MTPNGDIIRAATMEPGRGLYAIPLLRVPMATAFSKAPSVVGATASVAVVDKESKEKIKQLYLQLPLQLREFVHPLQDDLECCNCKLRPSRFNAELKAGICDICAANQYNESQNV